MATTRAAAKSARLQTLDDRLVALINTERRWEQFQSELLQPLKFRESEEGQSSGGCRGKREGFPLASDSYADNVDPTSMSTGRFYHLRALANALHMSALRHQDPPANASGEIDDSVYEVYYDNFFDRSYALRTFRSMSGPMNLSFADANTRCSVAQQLWLDGVSFPFTHNLVDALIVVAETDQTRTAPAQGQQQAQDDRPQQLYRWSLNGIAAESNVGRDSSDDTWRQKMCPLTHYRWKLPNSLVSTWSFVLDPNAVFIFNWYQFYLTRIEHLKETHDNYAAALKQQSDLQKKKRKLSDRYVEKSNRVKENVRAREVQLNRLAANERDKTRRFLVSLDKLYNEFTRNLPRGLVSRESVTAAAPSTGRR